MRWKGRRQSRNIEDRRFRRPGRKVALGGGLGTLALALLIFALGGDPMALLQGGTGVSLPSGGAMGDPTTVDPAEQEQAEMISVVLADTEEVWTELFRRSGRTYRTPTLVLFRDQVQSACGFQSAATGPFYCPGDQKIYIDLSFFDELQRRFGAPGDFAQAYVIAHEVGHHVQNLLGISDQMRARQSGASKAEANELSVRLELQADFLAGVWAHHAERSWNILEDGDLEEALRAAAAIGDDRLQRQSGRAVSPESFTHGTSAQRVRWFRRGLESGDLEDGDTFSVRDL